MRASLQVSEPRKKDSGVQADSPPLPPLIWANAPSWCAGTAYGPYEHRVCRRRRRGAVLGIGPEVRVGVERLRGTRVPEGRSRDVRTARSLGTARTVTVTAIGMFAEGVGYAFRPSLCPVIVPAWPLTPGETGRQRRCQLTRILRPRSPRVARWRHSSRQTTGRA